jgi:hypothetical protein
VTSYALLAAVGRLAPEVLHLPTENTTQSQITKRQETGEAGHH